MNPSYLVDTDWIIDHLNGRPAVAQRLKELRPAGTALSIVSVAELYEGAHYSRDPAMSQRMLGALLQEFDVLGIDEETCKTFGRERGRLRQAGNTVATSIF